MWRKSKQNKDVWLFAKDTSKTGKVLILKNPSMCAVNAKYVYLTGG